MQLRFLFHKLNYLMVNKLLYEIQRGCDVARDAATSLATELLYYFYSFQIVPFRLVQNVLILFQKNHPG